MGFLRVVSCLGASAAVLGCASVAVGMGRADQHPAADAARPVVSTSAPSTPPPAPQPGTPTSRASSTAAPQVTLTHVRAARATTSAAAPSSTTPPAPAAPRTTSAAPSTPTARPTTHAAARPHAAAAPATTSRAAARPAARSTAHRAPAAPAAARGGSLPLRYTTGSATQVITVVASHSWSTTARLQAWTKAPGGGWLKRGAQWTAHVGSQGLTTSPSESRSATPIGSFTLTQAFGRYRDPGTALPYFQTTYHDWWNSHPYSPYYNTHRHSGSSPDENLYAAGTVYNYAAVIDANTPNAPGGVHGGAHNRGSAFFLHVSDGGPTAGCVSVAQSKLVSMLQWLRPSGHPRILIGLG